MGKRPNQKLKLLYLQKILLEKTDEEHMMTVQQMIAELERCGISAERKSIYDDLEALELFGLDIARESGKAAKYYVASRDFELPELKLLVDSVQSARFITRKKSEKLIQKIAALASHAEGAKLQREVYVVNRSKAENEGIYYNVDLLHTAMGNNEKITFQYFDWQPDKSRKPRHGGALYNVSPWALTWDDENYYLIGYDAQAELIKHYRVDRMQGICLTGRAREGYELFRKFDIAVYSKKLFGMFHGEECVVTLRCKNHLAGVIIDKFGREAMLIPEEDGWFSVKVSVMVSPQFFSWVFSFENEIQIVSPKPVCEQMRKMIENVRRQYLPAQE